MTENRREIVEKQYALLGFDPSCDGEFQAVLSAADLSFLTDFSAYDPKAHTAADNLIACLYFAKELEQKYREKGIGRAILTDTLHDLVIWNDSHFRIHGHIGLDEFPWLSLPFDMKIFRLGRLQYEMSSADFDIEEAGLHIGDPLLQVHIPRGGPLTEDECLGSLAQVKPFFKTFYPDFPSDICVCHSWLLDETLDPLLGSSSNIRSFRKLFRPVSRNRSDAVLRYTFRWDATRENVGKFKPSSGFAARLRDAVADGRDFYEVSGFRPL